MKQAINIYKKHKMTVNNYLRSIVTNFKQDPISNAKELLSNNPSLQLIYTVDENYAQKSPVICRNSQDSTNIGANKSHYFQKVLLDEHDMYISNPYIHYRTGKASISIVHFYNNEYRVFDVDLIKLLEELKLIDFNQNHDKFKRIVYFLGSTSLAIVAITLIVYGIYIFGKILLSFESIDLLHDSFKSIVSITLGLAIFDLAKQIFENDVLFQTLEHTDDKQYKVLGRFLISIIIALSIETLLVVFKIALSDNIDNMLPAFYLIIGTTFMIIGLAWFYKTIKQSGCEFVADNHE